MKTLKLLALTSLILAVHSGSAFATTEYVEIVGAPAYRQDSNTNIAAYVAANGGFLTATTAPGTSTAQIESASANDWFIPGGGATSGDDLEIDASFTGSTAGFEAVASGGTATGAVTNLNQKFLTHTGNISTPLVSQTIATQYTADFTLSDTFQATTPFNGTKTFSDTSNSGGNFTATYNTLTGTALAVEPYYFVASPGAAAAGLTNITLAQAQTLFHNGSVPLSFFTGNSSDSSKTVYALSRDGGSGSRLVVQTEIGLGSSAKLVTYHPTITGGTVDSSGNYVNGTVTANPVWSAAVTPSTSIWAVQGNLGYASFGKNTVSAGLLQAITATPLSNTYYVTYLNTTDGAEAQAAGASLLTYNGSTYSTTAVEQGLYSFWSYQSLFPAATPTTIAATVASYLESNWTTVGEPLANLSVSRSADGGIITHN